LKKLLTKKKYIEEDTLEVQGNYNVIIQKTFPLMFQDPSSVTIPFRIGNLAIGKVLIDLGVSINLMPLSMLEEINGLKVKPTQMTLQLANPLIKCPYGVVEDVLVQVDKFTFLVDFVILYMKEDSEVPLILGRPFMKTTKVIKDVNGDKLTLRDQEEEVKFNMFEATYKLKLKDT